MILLLQMLTILTMSFDQQKIKVEASYSAKEKRVTLCVKNDSDKTIQVELFRLLLYRIADSPYPWLD